MGRSLRAQHSQGETLDQNSGQDAAESQISDGTPSPDGHMVVTGHSPIQQKDWQEKRTEEVVEKCSQAGGNKQGQWRFAKLLFNDLGSAEFSETCIARIEWQQLSYNN
ncbi:MAG: hypothetical protein AB8E87_06645 [Prochlorococcus sp.]